MGFDVQRGAAVLFGGADANNQQLDDTWEWQGPGWIQRAPANIPAARLDANLVYDWARGRVQMFGSTPSSLSV